MTPSEAALAESANPGSELLEMAPTSTVGRVIERIDDRLNPILVREVRQGLRGNAFRNLFWLTLLLATLVGGFGMSLRVIDGDEAGNGRTFFASMMGLLGLATGFFVPFVAFQSVSSEWEERTRDLLQLSGLSSWAIVRGKLVAALVQALLFYCAFLPFLAFAFLLRGLDLQEVIIGLNGSLAHCLVTTTIAIFLASLARTRTLRVFLFALLAVVLLFWSGISSASSAFLAFGRGGSVTLSIANLVGPWLFAAIPVSFGISFARNRFAHEYENQSTPLRVLTTFFLFATPVASFVTVFLAITGVGHVVAGTVISLLVGLTLITALFGTEGEKMSRRVAAHVPRRRLNAWLATPWLPGGGRGLIFYVVNAFLLILFALASSFLLGRMFDIDRPEMFAILFTALYGFIFIALATFFIRGERNSNNRRLLALLLAVGFPFVGGMLSGFGQALFGRSVSIAPYDFGNPFFVVTAAVNGRAGLGVLILLLAVALLCLALNAKRLRAAFAEVSEASAANRKRDAQANRLKQGQPALPTEGA